MTDWIDILQLFGWIVGGIFIAWGIFYAYVGFRRVPAYSKRRLARTAANIALVLGVAWCMFWVSAVVFNILQIFGGLPT